jgi:hypothetical protein
VFSIKCGFVIMPKNCHVPLIHLAEQGVLRFFKEGSPDHIGVLSGVHGVVSCAVQFTALDDEVELLPF